MVLVAVTGPVGAGKTTVLAEFADWMRDSGRPIDGFLAIPIDRDTPGQGAGSYVLRWLSSGDHDAFLVRDESLKPPYRLNPATAESARRWAEGLAAATPVPVVVLDEFGPIEAAGGGHLAVWPLLREACLPVVVIAVRDQVLADIEARLGQRFDVVVPAGRSDSSGRLRAVVLHHEDWATAGVFGAASGGFEASVGTALHAANVPLRGLFLSAVQSMIMLHAGERMSSRGRVVWVPFISAGLKALSPAGNRVRPMIAITAQGILFGASTALAGWNVVGVALGGWCIGAWSSGQSLILQYFFVGQDFVRALDAVVQWISARLDLGREAVIVFVGLWVVVSGTVTSAATVWSWRTRHRRSRQFVEMVEKKAGSVVWIPYHPSRVRAIVRGLHDLVRPQFWVPLSIIVAILAVSGSTWERVLWVVARAATVAWVLFSLVRMVDPEAIIDWLQRRGHWGPALAFRRAIRRSRTTDDPQRS